MSDKTYCYPPDYDVLKNKLGHRDAARLDRAERRLVTQRLQEPVPTGDFDWAHLRAIHHHLFQDIFDWAGELRTVEISKGGSQFQFRQYIETGMADVHRRVRAHNYLRDLDVDAFADLAGEIMGDVNYVHPFREGNGRAQLQYFKQLAEQAGFEVALWRLPDDRWMEASRQAHMGDYGPMTKCLRQTLFEPKRPPPDKTRGKRR
ncbi:MAG: Fic family protein [Pseudomonadota bacterium]